MIDLSFQHYLQLFTQAALEPQERDISSASLNGACGFIGKSAVMKYIIKCRPKLV